MGQNEKSENWGTNHLHALAAGIASRVGKWCTTLMYACSHLSYIQKDDVASTITSVMRVLSALPQHDSPVPQWLLAIFWSPILQMILCVNCQHQTRVHKAHRGAPSVLALCYISLLRLRSFTTNNLSQLPKFEGVRACCLLLRNWSNAYLVDQCDVSIAVGFGNVTSGSRDLRD